MQLRARAELRDQPADASQADDREGLARDLAAGEAGLVDLDPRRQRGVITLLGSEALRVRDALDHAPCREEEGAQGELLDRVGVGAGRTEDLVGNRVGVRGGGEGER